jgi:type II secretory pathway component PulJ
MGAQVMIDLIGSIVVFGWLLLMTLRVNTANNENMQTLNGDLLVQENLVAVTQLLEYDFRKIGFCKEPNNLPDPTKAIVLADTSRIKFLTDVDNGGGPDGVVDSVYYYLGPTSELSQTPNPRDRYLYRVVNAATPKGANLGITSFTMKYFDRNGVPIPTPVGATELQKIQTVQITLSVENVYASTIVETTNKQYSSAFWQQVRLSSRNYRNR